MEEKEEKIEGEDGDGDCDGEEAGIEKNNETVKEEDEQEQTDA